MIITYKIDNEIKTVFTVSVKFGYDNSGFWCLYYLADGVYHSVESINVLAIEAN